MSRNITNKGKCEFILVLRNSCQQPSTRIEMGSSPLTRRLHEEHNGTYCDLPSTFLLDGFPSKLEATQSHFTYHKRVALTRNQEP